MMASREYTNTQTIYDNYDTGMIYYIKNRDGTTESCSDDLDLEELEELEAVAAVTWYLIWQLIAYKIILQKIIDLRCRSPGIVPG